MKSSVIREGMDRVCRARRTVLLGWILNVGLALVLGAAMARSIEDSLGDSAAAEGVLESIDPRWYDGFEAEAEGLDATFDPTLTGIGGVLAPLEDLLTGAIFREHPAALGLALAYTVFWTVLGGGFLGVYRSGACRRSLFAAAGKYFVRMVVLGVLGGGIFFALYTYALPEIVSTFDEAVRDVADERVFALFVAAKFGAMLLALLVVKVILTYAKVVTVARDVSLWATPFTLFRGLWIGLRHPLRTLGLYLFAGVVLAVLAALYGAWWRYSPGFLAPGSTAGIVASFAIGQAFVLGRITVRCGLLAGSMAIYEDAAGLGPVDDGESPSASGGDGDRGGPRAAAATDDDATEFVPPMPPDVPNPGGESATREGYGLAPEPGGGSSAASSRSHSPPAA